MNGELDPVLLIPIDLRSWVREREAILIAEENELFRRARDQAGTPEEQAYWDEFLRMRERNQRESSNINVNLRNGIS